MRLRVRAITLLALANTAVFILVALFVFEEARRSAKREREMSLLVARELTPLLGSFLEDAVPGTDPAQIGTDLRRMLDWPHWSRMRDAVFIDRTARIDSETTLATGRLFLNPLGTAQRGADFDMATVTKMIDLAMSQKLLVEGNIGIAVPVIRDGEMRGGAFFAFRESRVEAWSPIGLLITFLVSTILLTSLVGYLVATFVVEPVEKLADVSRRIASGDLGAAPKPHDHDDEIGELNQSMRVMLKTLRDHRLDLERACEIAAERAKTAERDLLTAQRLASLGTLAAGIAHEINNPLGGLTNAVRALRDEKVPVARRGEYYDLVLEGLERIRAIVGRVLTMAPRRAPLRAEKLLDCIRDAVALSEHKSLRDNVRVIVHAPGLECKIMGDRGELAQVFLNLLFNAVDAIVEQRAGSKTAQRRDGIVEITTTIQGTHVEVAVCDNGPGIPPSFRGRVFDPFFTTKDPDRGSGLGLTVVYGIVRNHGGSITLSDAPSGGLCVTLRFPLAPDAAT